MELYGAISRTLVIALWIADLRCHIILFGGHVVAYAGKIGPLKICVEIYFDYSVGNSFPELQAG